MTPRELQCLTFIRSYIEEHSVSPTYTEIACGIGIVSRGSVSRLLYGLKRNGRVSRSPRRFRSIVVLDDQVSPEILGSLSDEALSDVVSHAAGILAHRRGAVSTATAFRRIADALLTRRRAA